MLKEGMPSLSVEIQSICNESVQKSGPSGPLTPWAQGRQPCVCALSLAPQACPPCNFGRAQNPQINGCRMQVLASACRVTLGASLPCPALSVPACEMEKLYYMICTGPVGILSPQFTIWANKIILVKRTRSDPQVPCFHHPSPQSQSL